MSYPVDDAAELDNCAVSSALDEAPVMHGEDRIDQVAAKGAGPSENSILVRASKPRVADDVGYQDGCKLSGLVHRALFRTAVMYHDFPPKAAGI
jgi:hypothetical protein